jgi:hypothetical protein
VAHITSDTMSKTFTNKEVFGKKALNEYGVLGMHWGKGKKSQQPYTAQDRHDRKLPGAKNYSKEIMAKFAAKDFASRSSMMHPTNAAGRAHKKKLAMHAQVLGNKLALAKKDPAARKFYFGKYTSSGRTPSWHR